MSAMGNRNTAEAVDAGTDVQVVGNPDQWALICKTSSEAEGWMKSTKAMQIDGAGCLVQVTTEKRGLATPNPGEALSFVPGVVIATDDRGNRYLRAWNS